MTNAQVAAYFAALPPDEEAQIVEVGEDAGFWVELTIAILNEDHVKDIDDLVGKLGVLR